MPEITPNLGIKKPKGNESVTRDSFNENWDIIDQNAAKKADLDMHLADTTTHVMLDNTFDGDDQGSDYPQGVTIFKVDANNTTWPIGFGTVVNYKYNNTRFTQFFCAHGDDENIGFWFRHWYSGDGWTDWQEVLTTTEGQALVNDLAGEGRTTETVKGNADAIAAHQADTANPHSVTSEQINMLTDNSKDDSNSVDDYPIGVTVMRVNDDDLSLGFPQGYGILQTSRHDGNNGLQIFQRTGANHNLYIRNTNSGVWEDWNELSVIEEKNSNDNGEYIRFTDGTQICWKYFGRISVTPTSGPTVQGITPYVLSDWYWNFPATFSEEPFTTASGHMSGHGFEGFMLNSTYTTYAFWDFQSMIEFNELIGVCVLAIGKWK